MDMSPLLRDPAFCEPFDVLHRVEALLRGRAVISVMEEPALGVIQPAQGKDLERLPEADRDKETIAVFTDMQLSVGEEDGPTKADGVRWNGGIYTVTSVEAWPKYGYCKALCQREEAV